MYKNQDILNCKTYINSNNNFVPVKGEISVDEDCKSVVLGHIYDLDFSNELNIIELCKNKEWLNLNFYMQIELDDIRKITSEIKDQLLLIGDYNSQFNDIELLENEYDKLKNNYMSLNLNDKNLECTIDEELTRYKKRTTCIAAKLINDRLKKVNLELKEYTNKYKEQ